jgi:glyoxylase-like metal-dependent hydrolase (beta-lactamase superfamily II)
MKSCLRDDPAAQRREYLQSLRAAKLLAPDEHVLPGGHRGSMAAHEPRRALAAPPEREGAVPLPDRPAGLLPPE